MNLEAAVITRAYESMVERLMLGLELIAPTIKTMYIQNLFLKTVLRIRLALIIIRVGRLIGKGTLSLSSTTVTMILQVIIIMDTCILETLDAARCYSAINQRHIFLQSKN